MTHLFRWDLDKTYLQTDFDSVKGLVRSALQSAEEKENVPGTGALMRELTAPTPGVRNRIHIVSGSPRQMRRVLERKLRLDGARVESLTLKPNVGNLLRLRFRAVKDQLGYKLPALLESRVAMAPELRETCFGDDAEVDGVVYRLYADICGGRVDASALDGIIAEARLYEDQGARIREAARLLTGKGDPVDRILIHLETGSPTARFAALGPRVVPTFNTLQAALVLFSDGRLSVDGFANVVEEMRAEYDYGKARLERSLEDAVRRGIVERERVADALAATGLAAKAELRVAQRPAESPVDYVAVLHEMHAYRKTQKKRNRLRDHLKRALRLDD